MRPIFASFFLMFCTLIPANHLFSLEQLDGDLSLIPKPPPKSEVFGIVFGDDSATVSEKLTAMGLQLEEQKMVDQEGTVRVITFTGTPKDIPVESGRSQLVFFNDQLIRMDFLFPPSYENFLKVRGQLFYSLGDRFQVTQKREVIEDQLRSHLANLQAGEFSAATEKKILSTMAQGSTFFFYGLDDKKDELNVTYSYYSPPHQTRTKNRELRLHYSMKNALEDYKDSVKSKKTEKNRSILPKQN